MKTRKNSARPVLATLLLALVAYAALLVEPSLLTGILSGGSQSSQNEILPLEQTYAQLRNESQIIEFDVRQDSSDIVNYVEQALAYEDAEHIGPYIEFSQLTGANIKTSATQGLGGWNVHYIITASYLDTPEQEDEFESQLAQTIDELDLKNPELSQRAKLSRIHEFIQDHVEYSADQPVYHTAYSALCNRAAVCQGYTALFYRLATAASVQNAMVTGSLQGVPHSWNIVNIDGTWLHVDETACDTSRQHSKYYLVGGLAPSTEHEIDKEYASKYF